MTGDYLGREDLERMLSREGVTFLFGEPDSASLPRSWLSSHSTQERERALSTELAAVGMLFVSSEFDPRLPEENQKQAFRAFYEGGLLAVRLATKFTPAAIVEKARLTHDISLPKQVPTEEKLEERLKKVRSKLLELSAQGAEQGHEFTEHIDRIGHARYDGAARHYHIRGFDTIVGLVVEATNAAKDESYAEILQQIGTIHEDQITEDESWDVAFREELL